MLPPLLTAQLTPSQCFKYIVNSPPGPLTQEDIWFQIGHVHEQQKDVGPSTSKFLASPFLR